MVLIFGRHFGEGSIFPFDIKGYEKSCRKVFLPPRSVQNLISIVYLLSYQKRGSFGHNKLRRVHWTKPSRLAFVKFCVPEYLIWDHYNEQLLPSFSFQDWMVFEGLHRPLFREHGSVYFANGKKPSKEFNYAFCEVCSPLYCLLLWWYFYLSLCSFNRLCMQTLQVLW